MPESQLTYTDLITVNFGSFGATVGDWKKVQSALKRLAKQARSDMRAKSERADWAGANADAVRPFIRKIANEVGDLHTEAQSIWNVIDDAHRELVRIQGRIEDERERAKRKQISIKDNDDGTVTCDFAAGTDGATTASGYYVGGSADSDEPNKPRSKADREARDEIQSHINHLIGKAREIDASTSRALQRSHKGDRHNAGHASYKSLDHAQASEAKGLAEKQLKLYREGKELSTKDLARLAEITKYNAKDAEFSTTFYRDLGPKKALLLHAQMGIDASTDGGEARLELARTVQNSMGTGLATATQSHGGNPLGTDGDRTHLGENWIAALKRVGKDELPLSNGGNQRTLGYQVLGNVLRHGEYDKEFLSGVANDMVTYEREHGGPGRAWPLPLTPEDGGPDLNLDKGKDRGFDPMTGLMKGLGHSPDAATDFFRGSTEVDGKEVDNFDYFLGDEEGKKVRDWPTGDSGKDALGGALEAATTGRPAGDEGKPLKHTEEQAALFYEVVERLGSEAGSPLVQHDGELAQLRSHMGSMAADYMHGVHRGMAASPSGIIGIHGADPGLNDVDGEALERFLRSASQDSDGYASIMHASHVVSRESIQAAMSHPAPGHSPSEAASTGAQPGADVAALASEGRADGIVAAKDKVGAAERYNESLDAKQEVVGQIVDLGVGMMPRGGEAVGLVTGEIQSVIFDSYKKDPEEIAEQVQESRKDFLAEERRREGETMERITRISGQGAGLDPDSVDWAASKVHNDVARGYRDQ
ncbi:hypothetical protein ACQEU8_32545 [Streptomyces sp. CA-250714]|uniref:hypothetical protein n=1 Tax=Streptomyces sp. CA-250714 TaxID=3240060 RepID=UPI003D93ED16